MYNFSSSSKSSAYADSTFSEKVTLGDEVFMTRPSFSSSEDSTALVPNTVLVTFNPLDKILMDVSTAPTSHLLLP